MAKNPFEGKDGAPIEGKAKEFWDWVRRERERKLAKMSPTERQKAIAAQEHLAQKMQSGE